MLAEHIVIASRGLVTGSLHIPLCGSSHSLRPMWLSHPCLCSHCLSHSPQWLEDQASQPTRPGFLKCLVLCHKNSGTILKSPSLPREHLQGHLPNAHFWVSFLNASLLHSASSCFYLFSSWGWGLNFRIAALCWLWFPPAWGFVNSAHFYGESQMACLPLASWATSQPGLLFSQSLSEP
jgi:hypothetical protein